MTTCTTCLKPLEAERIALVFKTVPGNVGFCEECMLGEEATKILAGLAERKRIDGW